MGYSLSWLAVKNVSELDILNKVCAKRTGNKDEAPDYDFNYMERDGEWRWLIENRVDMIRDKEDWLTVLSSGAELVCVVVEEHVMYSAATGWKDGKRLWSIEHDNERGGLEDIKATGALPETYEKVRTDLLQKLMADPETDYMFDVPTRVAELITGFKHDEAPKSADTFWELKSTLGRK